MAFWNRFPYSNFHEINLDWLLREMKKISGSVSDFARQWEKALKQETGERQEADRQLQENIDAETSRAEEAEKALDDKITAETNRATEAEEALDQKIEAETDRATEKENNLQEQITAEVGRATAAEGVLDSKITAETSRATGVENELRGLITTETERATAAEGALGDRIDGLEGELEGVTGADSPFIRKDGTTTTTGKIPLAQGGTSEVDPANPTDLVNLRSMQAADQALESSMTEYVDNQLEAVTGDIHSIPAGGTTGQVLGKVDGTDYNVHWVDQTGGGTPGPEGPQGPKGDPGPAGPGVAAGGTAGQLLSKVDGTDYNTQWIDPPSGSDPDAIKKDGTTTTTARIPFAEGIASGSNILTGEVFKHTTPIGENTTYTGITNNLQGASITSYGDRVVKAQVKVTSDTTLEITADGSSGTSGQVLTAKGDGTCGWADAGAAAFEFAEGTKYLFIKQGNVVWAIMKPDVSILVTGIQLRDLGAAYFSNITVFDVDTIPEGFRPYTATFKQNVSAFSANSIGEFIVAFNSSGRITAQGSVFAFTDAAPSMSFYGPLAVWRTTE